MARIDIRGVELNYQKQGSGPTLVLGHSLVLDNTMYDELTEHLATDYTVIRLDFRGHGASAKPHERYSINQMADDLVGFVDVLAPGPFAYGGLSLGGMVGMRMALQRTDRLAGLVLMDTSADLEPRRVQFEAWAESTKGKPVSESDVENFLKMSVSREFFAENPPALDRIRAQMFQNDSTGSYYASMAVLGRESIVELVSGIDSPTLVIVGDKDFLTPPAHAEVIAAHIDGARLVTVEGASHWTAVEQPQHVAGLIHEHLKPAFAGL